MGDGAGTAKIDGGDEIDFSAALRRRDRAEAIDDIDGRGTFDAKEIEKELRSLHRSELEDQLGIVDLDSVGFHF